jgi:hypothetical protein
MHAASHDQEVANLASFIHRSPRESNRKFTDFTNGKRFPPSLCTILPRELPLVIGHGVKPDWLNTVKSIAGENSDRFAC